METVDNVVMPLPGNNGAVCGYSVRFNAIGRASSEKVLTALDQALESADLQGPMRVHHGGRSVAAAVCV